MTNPLPWVGPMFDADSLCAEVDPEIWFPEGGGSAATAKSLCRRCENEDACLAWALANQEQSGIWGATTPRERARILRDRPSAPASRFKPIRHGTEAGYKAHARRGDVIPETDPCGCRAASKLASNLRHQRAQGQVAS